MQHRVIDGTGLLLCTFRKEIKVEGRKREIIDALCKIDTFDKPLWHLLAYRK